MIIPLQIILLAAPISTTLHTGALDSILYASPVVQVTLLILATLSVFSWAVGLNKWSQFKNLSSSNDEFLELFWKSKSLDDLYEKLSQYKKSSIAHVFKSAYLELQKLADSKTGETSSLQLSGIDNIERALRKAIDTEISLMESRMTLLATTGSTGPFIGLFGTVWGIMSSFQKIGVTGSASLAVVAPGISEALITTAIGLATAIPAVILYNHFIAKIKRQEVALNNFSTDFLNIAKRNFFKE